MRLTPEHVVAQVKSDLIGPAASPLVSRLHSRFSNAQFRILCYLSQLGSACVLFRGRQPAPMQVLMFGMALIMWLRCCCGWPSLSSSASSGTARIATAFCVRWKGLPLDLVQPVAMAIQYPLWSALRFRSSQLVLLLTLFVVDSSSQTVLPPTRSSPE